MVFAKEEPDLTIPPALDGLLKIHKHIIDSSSDASNAPVGGTFCTRLLVAATQAGSLIGKQGATIKSIQDDSHCTVRIIGGGNVCGVELVLYILHLLYYIYFLKLQLNFRKTHL